MLSKIMSTAALIAASTALASAATVVFTTASSASGATEIVTLNKTGTSYDEYATTTDDAGKTVEKTPTYPITYSYTAKTSFGASALSFKYAISGGKIWTDAASNSTNTNTALDTAFNEATGLSLSDYAGQKFYGSGSFSSSVTLTFSNLKANTEYRFSFVGAGRGSDCTLSIGTKDGSETKVGEFSDTERGGGSFYGLMSASEKTKLTSDTITLAEAATTTYKSNGDPDKQTIDKASSAATIVVKSDENGEVIFTSTGSKPGFVAIAISDVIPEPSAFGLLAGIGALALAVSRRKRRA